MTTFRRPSKYKNQRTEAASGGIFASKREADKADELRMWEKVGAISDLQFQVKYELVAGRGAIKPICYFADFVYTDLKDGKIHVIDAKGFARNAVYVLKKKMMKLLLDIDIEEV